MVGGRRSALYSVAAVVVFVVLWQLATLNTDPTLFPPPTTVADAAVELITNGTLGSAILISLQRVFLGWILGSVIAIPLGILAGTSRVARAIVDPFIHFFRFVPALALVSVFILWFGIGEASKVNLVAYSAAFIVMVNTASGAASVHADKLNAARSMGAGRFTLLRAVVFPATVPHIFTGMRLALANAFLVIVAARRSPPRTASASSSGTRVPTSGPTRSSSASCASESSASSSTGSGSASARRSCVATSSLRWLPTSQPGGPVRPNVLVVFLDDHAQWALGCYGNREVQTPTLDYLAETGVRMENSFTPPRSAPPGGLPS